MNTAIRVSVATSTLLLLVSTAGGMLARADAAAPTSATAVVATQTPVSSATRPPPTEGLPPTPGPDTPTPPTPALPEEGGPQGGVLGGHMFSDDDGDGKRSAGDSAVVAGVGIDRILSDSSDLGPRFFSATTDLKGYWEVRGLPDGRYRVSWLPPVRDPADLAKSIPPPEDVVLDPEHTARLSIHIVDIVKSNRILDIDFGIPHQNPVSGAAGTRTRLPNTGAGDRGGLSANEFVLFGGLAASAVLALGLAVARRRTAHR